ncbi:mitochondrial 37s ribosomal protein mrps8 [Diplodia corticola]|uniref:Mitochondrial 37s ribosomal protein mrps8 n=1 Tax=Diplodia corticola TaxID=236234 RepID=A0A1J9SA94_9PEZI|nr:mitochondrial 37s ribosomal protein mrps8 [Diplodia corticola]OJD36804.1 mitochondrial 37s ribosomal protein mrps8 [Diplodia corticola]
MSLVHLANICSHLQNASRGRLGLTSIPLTKLHLTLALGLQKQGFISTVQPGGPTPPPTFALREAPSHGPSDEALAAEPWRAYPDPPSSRSDATKTTTTTTKTSSPPPTSRSNPDEGEAAPAIPKNKALQRLWLGLKYWNNEPVLNRMTLVSKPTKRIWLNSSDLGVIVRGFEANQVKGLTRPGECLFVTTDRGVLEARECAEKKLGGMVLCRVR